NSFREASEAYQSYRKIHKQTPQRHYLFASTVNEELKIKIHYWAGIRRRIEKYGSVQVGL
ncbi:MAG: hypothetical protein MJK04_19380, partial [Psychrosphaera sp.]|nr:hypothetical protein [Psychrosphaera sp.]